MIWPTTKLKWAATTIAGGTPSVADPSNWADGEDGTAWVSISDMSGSSSVTSTNRRVTAEGIAEARLPIGEPGTLILSMYASLGHTAFLAVRASWNQAILGIYASPSHDPRFLKYALDAIKSTLSEIARSNTQANLNAEQVGNLAMPNPPLEEQRRIADFLDAETARIDALTDRRTVQQQLLVERRTALKTRCVTYSGPQKVRHPLLGDIHPDWQVLPLRRILPAINVGVVINPSHYFTESGVPFIHGFNVREGFISQVGMKFMSGESNELHRRSRVYAGDVLVVRAGATAGRAAKVGEDFNGANCASVLILRKSEALDAAYLEAFINSVAGKGQVSFSQYGAAQEVISAGQVSSFSIALPPVGEQVERVTKLSTATAETVALESGLTRQVALLSERRQALITAAVTGQFDVSTASGRNVTDGVSV